jgi:RNA polymerase sigma-70 factor, ECF subfamily
MHSFPELPMPEILLDPEESARAAAVYPDWSDLVSRIRSGQTDGMEELYRLFSRGIRFYLVRQLGTAGVDDAIHDIFLSVVQAIRRDELRDPERLMGFVRTIVRRQAATGTSDRQPRTQPLDLRQENPEEAADFHRKAEFVDQVMAALSQRDREILTRFYLHEESQDQICKEMALSETQFRLLKSRAKARFGELGKRKLEKTERKSFFSPREQSLRMPDTGEITRSADPPPSMERILPVVAHAVAVFGDENKASHWLATPLQLFDNRSPSQLLEERDGIDLVEQVLTRIEHNIPS